MKDMGEDPNRQGLLKTPGRMYDSLSFLTSGYKEDLDKIMNEAIFTESYQDMVIIRDIDR